MIAADAARSVQTVADWKSARSPIPQPILTSLAERYGVSYLYLAGYCDDPQAMPPVDPKELPDKMSRVVLDLISRFHRPVSPTIAVQLCAVALHKLQEGCSEEELLGTVYKQLLTCERSSADLE